PAVLYGFILDSMMELFRKPLYLRVLSAGVIGGAVNQVALMGVKLLFGMPWSGVVKLLLGVHLATSLVVNIIAVHLALLVWRGLERSGWVGRISGWRTG
ncbi:MAG: hypothetical protein U9N45_07255, partial [Gemmatimonadota bacterium]|nr:hypothetical protein [Gemmatimonadota bacterium]